MVVVNCRAGQRSNRLVVAAHAMATTIVHGETLRLTTFDEYNEDYACKSCGGMRVVIRGSYFWECVRLLDSAAKKIFRYKRLSIPRVLTLASDWNYRDYESLSRCEDKVRDFFTPVNVEQPKKMIGELRRADRHLIGVHIRRKDYKTFVGGRYYFDDSIYRREMKRVMDFWKDCGNKMFLVFSDENVDETSFAGLPCRFMHGTAVEDQWMMSQCDYLMGPPSTFSAWASFMGRVPLARMWNKDYELKPEDFAYRGLVA